MCIKNTIKSYCYNRLISITFLSKYSCKKNYILKKKHKKNCNLTVQISLKKRVVRIYFIQIMFRSKKAVICSALSWSPYFCSVFCVLFLFYSFRVSVIIVLILLSVTVIPSPCWFVFRVKWALTLVCLRLIVAWSPPQGW